MVGLVAGGVVTDGVVTQMHQSSNPLMCGTAGLEKEGSRQVLGKETLELGAGKPVALGDGGIEDDLYKINTIVVVLIGRFSFYRFGEKNILGIIMNPNGLQEESVSSHAVGSS